MTVSNTTSRWSYTGDGSTTIFTYDNKIFASSELQVYSDGVLQTETTDYTVSGVGVATGGNVTYVTAPANNVAVVIVRNVADTQSVALPAGGPFPALSVEDALDRRTIISQQLNDLFSNRTLSLDASDTPVTLNTIPLKATRASKYLAFDSDGQPIASAAPEGGNVVSVFMATVLDDADAAAARTTLGAGVGDAVKADAATWAKTQTWSKGADIASASALTLGTDGNAFDVTGTTTITSIGTVGVGTWVLLQFDGAVLLTHHATDLILPGAANVTTAAGDIFMFHEYATGDWRCMGYVLASGKAIVAPPAPTVIPSPNFTSAEQTVAADTLLQVAHGLSAIPSQISVSLRCKTADAGYSVGDEILSVDHSHTSADRGFVISADTTNIEIIQGAGIQIINKSTFNATNITVGSWRWVIRAWT